MTEESYYEAIVECSNCKKKSDIPIPKGMTVEEFFEEVRLKGKREEPICSNCGCRTLRAPLN